MALFAALSGSSSRVAIRYQGFRSIAAKSVSRLTERDDKLLRALMGPVHTENLIGSRLGTCELNRGRADGITADNTLGKSLRNSDVHLLTYASEDSRQLSVVTNLG